MRLSPLFSNPRGRIFAAAFLSAAAGAFAQVPAFKLGAIYECSAAQSFQVISCTGPGNADQCDVQSYAGGKPNMRGQSTRQQVMTLLPLCHLQTPQEAQAQARGATSPGAPAQADANGFKIGDTVQINTAFGWMDGKIIAMNGNDYQVRAQNGVDVRKTYPAELHRIGPPTARDKAAGLYETHDRVQVNFEGQWIDSEVLGSLGMDYQVAIPGNRTAWANLQQLRYVGPAVKPATPTAGTPPKPGLTSCAGKIEGRYASTGGFVSLTITFRSGKATVTELSGSDDYECWMGGGKIFLHKPGEPANLDIPIDINNDGSLQTPFGDITKKGN